MQIMKKGRLVVLVLLLFISYSALAQTYEVPKNYVLKTNDDYVRYEANVISTVDWMQQTPWANEPEKQTQAKKFLTEWATGSPYVTVEISQPLLRLCRKNPQLLLTYMGQFIKYALQHKTGFNKNADNVFAIKALLAKYTSEKTHKKDSAIDELIVVDGQGKLEDWIKTGLYDPQN